MAFPPRFLDELRERVPLSQLIGKKVKLTRRGREYTGLCPFHHEKTPSFTINDDKGFYHCFGCGVHGDAIRYLTDGEKMPFLEAVEYLAHLAGVQMPQLTREDAQKRVAYQSELEIMEAACAFFQAQLFSPNGEAARRYLQNRGITSDIAKKFRLGYAPKGSALLAHLTEKGYSIKTALSLGLVADGQGARPRHDYFYDRLMFPILNRRLKVIAFGGRLLEKGEPKYLNSPETSLFHKGEQLYALPNAIETIRRKNQAILVEGYMDVIALHSAGFTNAVAPLGTAFTEQQLRLLWQSCDEPLICFDGDGAGRKASVRAMNRAIPILTPGKSLQFVFLPDPYDPDDMIRKKSPQAFQEALDNAQTLAWTLWNTLTEGRSLDTPERRAKLEKDALETVQKIQNENVRAYYLKDIKNRLWQLAHRKKGQQGFASFHNALSITKPAAGQNDGRMLLAYFICFPKQAQSVLEEVAGLRLQEKEMQALFDAVMELLIAEPDITAEVLQTRLKEQTGVAFPQEVEMLQKSDRSEQEVQEELEKWTWQLRLHALTDEKNEKLKQFQQNPTAELWQEITIIKEEIEKITINE